MGKQSAPLLPISRRVRDKKVKAKKQVSYQRVKGKGKKGTVYTYRRVSTPTNKKKAGNRRHQEATRREAERRLLNIGKSIEDIVSGSLPADQREMHEGWDTE